MHKHFAKMLANNPLVGENPKKALEETWDEVEAAFRKEMDVKFEKKKETWTPPKDQPDKKCSYPGDGSTATVVFQVGTKFFIGSCGDSTCGVIKADKTLEKFTKEHHTTDPDEVARVLKAGGEFKQKVFMVPAGFPLCCVKKVEKKLGKPRIMPGGLLVTRAFGDLHAKIPEVGGLVGGVIHTPDPIREIELSEDWIYMVIASDGIWDTFDHGGKVFHQIFADEREQAEFDIAPNGVDTETEERIRRRMVKTMCQTCVDSEYWQKSDGEADNTTAIILFFNNKHTKVKAPK